MTEPIEAPAQEKFFRAPWYLKPKIDPEVQATIRQMLNVDEDDDLPENVLHMLALCSAFTPDFNDKIGGLTGRWELGMRILEAELIVRPLKEKAWIKAGEKVTIRSQNREAVYVSGGPGNTDLVNMYGIFMLVRPADIDADPLSIVDSDESKLVAQGKLAHRRLKAAQAGASEAQALVRG